VGLDELLARRLIFITGKGGVGKSSVAAALALAAVDRGRRVLLAEIDAPVSLGLTLAGAPAKDQPSPVRPGLDLVNLRPGAVIDEYVHHAVKLAWVARKVLDSPIYRRFIAAAPGLAELMCLGKLMALDEGLAGNPARWDTLIVDAPATGHGLALLRVPLIASQAVPIGPVGRNARRILAMLRDKTRSAVVVVAIPEEMAVVDAEQFLLLARGELQMQVASIVLNACHERVFAQREEALVLERLAGGEDSQLAPGVTLCAALLAARRQIRRARLTRFYARRLRREPEPVWDLPYVFGNELGLSGLLQLASRLETA